MRDILNRLYVQIGSDEGFVSTQYEYSVDPGNICSDDDAGEATKEDDTYDREDDVLYGINNNMTLMGEAHHGTLC